MQHAETMTDSGSFTTIERLREEFPILHQSIGDYPLVYLDNAATTQKPMAVIESITDYYTGYNANIHRGVHHLANVATEAFEKSREDIRSFLNAERTEEILFTSGTTDSINLVAQTYGRMHLQEGDEILVSELEHHSNIVPWQMLAAEKKAILRVIPVNDRGEWNLDSLESLISSRTRIIAISHVSNALGTINPVERVIQAGRSAGSVILIDGAQAVAHQQVDVQQLDCDFYCFSGHKLFGPTGTGVLYGKYILLEAMKPWRGGGEMIRTVSFSGTTFNDPPHKFEAGTPHIEGVIGLGAAVRFVRSLGWKFIHHQEQTLLEEATRTLLSIEGLRIYGTADLKAPVISFLVDGVHPYDLGTLLDKQGIAVRTGHHCTQPLWERYGIPGTVRASFSVYNTVEEINLLKAALDKALPMLR